MFNLPIGKKYKAQQEAINTNEHELNDISVNSALNAISNNLSALIGASDSFTLQDNKKRLELALQALNNLIGLKANGDHSIFISDIHLQLSFDSGNLSSLKIIE